MSDHDHSGCRQVLLDMLADQRTDAAVSTEPPLVASPYGANSFICPHKVEFFIEPTGEQIARWVRDRVE